MLSTVAGIVGHGGAPLRPHDVWTAWSPDPVAVVVAGVASWCFVRGWRPADDPRRAVSFAAGVVVALVAVVSPVDAVADVLLSAHMVQHVLLVAVSAPLLALADPGPIMLRGAPTRVRRTATATRRRLGLDIVGVRRLRHPIARWLCYVGTFWTWHAALLYGLAVEHDVVHALEHATMLGAALAVWSAIAGSRRVRSDRGVGVLLAFLLTVQGVLLAALMTFSTMPWYEAYSSPAPGWALDPLADQHLAGVIMWIPTGSIYTATGVALAVAWLRDHAGPDPGSPTTRAWRRPVLGNPHETPIDQPNDQPNDLRA